MFPAEFSASSYQMPSYNNAGVALESFHSEPTKRITPTPESSSENQDTVSLSPEGMRQAQQMSTVQGTGSAEETGEENNQKQQAAKDASYELSQEEQQMVQELKQRDREVRAHEQAHLAAAGQYAKGGPTFTYQQGPDGRKYAIGGEVPIDVSAEKTPEETINKMRAVKRAANAPADPSSADRSVAATAASNEAQARQELQEEQNTENEADSESEQPAESTIDITA